MTAQMLTASDVGERSEIERRGEILYQNQVKQRVEPQHIGDFIALDINSGDYCVDADELTALRGLRRLQPNARVYFARVGSSVVYELRGATAAFHFQAT